MTYHLGADYFEDPDGTFVSQSKKYIDKLADTYKRLFNEDPPKGYKTHLALQALGPSYCVSNDIEIVDY